MAISWNQRRAYKRERFFEILINKNKLQNYNQRKMDPEKKKSFFKTWPAEKWVKENQYLLDRMNRMVSDDDESFRSKF